MDGPNIVLAHGAWEDGSAWNGVIERLQARGCRVTAPQFPVTTLADNVSRLQQVLDLQRCPAVVAGHCCSSRIITALGADPANVIALVYMADCWPCRLLSAVSLRIPQPACAANAVNYAAAAAVGNEVLNRED